MKDWWQQRSGRERRLLLAATLLLAAGSGYALVWAPWQRHLSALRQQVAEQRGDLAWMRQVAGQLQHQPAAPANRPDAPSGVALASTVDRTARASGLATALRRLEPQSDGSLQVWLTHARFADLIGWLAAIEQRHGISVTAAELTRRGNGQVDGRLNLSGG